MEQLKTALLLMCRGMLMLVLVASSRIYSVENKKHLAAQNTLQGQPKVIINKITELLRGAHKIAENIQFSKDETTSGFNYTVEFKLLITDEGQCLLIREDRSFFQLTYGKLFDNTQNNITILNVPGLLCSSVYTNNQSNIIATYTPPRGLTFFHRSTGHTYTIACHRHDNTLLACSNDGESYIVADDDNNNDNAIWRSVEGYHHNLELKVLQTSSDCHVIVGIKNGLTSLCRISKDIKVLTRETYPAAANFQLSPSGNLLALYNNKEAGNRSISIYDTRHHKEIALFNVPSNQYDKKQYIKKAFFFTNQLKATKLVMVNVNEEDQYMTHQSQVTINQYDLSDKTTTTLYRGNLPTFFIKHSPNGRYLLIGNETNNVLLDLETTHLQAALSRQSEPTAHRPQLSHLCDAAVQHERALLTKQARLTLLAGTLWTVPIVTTLFVKSTVLNKGVNILASIGAYLLSTMAIDRRLRQKPRL